MNLVLLTHPAFLGLTSQAHFARMLAEGFSRRGHAVQLRQPAAMVRRLLPRGPLAKWAGYVDQYLLFPAQLLLAARADPADALYVFCDQALGPWVPWLARRPHVVHCHDLLALRSALGELPQHRTGWSGQRYQRFIRWGFRHARHFISISSRTREDLHRVGQVQAVTSEVVHNGLNRPYRRRERSRALEVLAHAGLPTLRAPGLVHVGGGQWYKNPVGVVELYVQHVLRTCAAGRQPRPLWMVSPPPDAALTAALAQVPEAGDVRFVDRVGGEVLEALYSVADVLLFPSLAEGFGWPIVEALACGCAVVTTGEAPMTEVGGAQALYLPPPPLTGDRTPWAMLGAELIDRVLARTPAERDAAQAAAIDWAQGFGADRAIDAYLDVYGRVLAHEARLPIPTTVSAR